MNASTEFLKLQKLWAESYFIFMLMLLPVIVAYVAGETKFSL